MALLCFLLHKLCFSGILASDELLLQAHCPGTSDGQIWTELFIHVMHKHAYKEQQIELQLADW
jgi:hypothetical protein